MAEFKVAEVYADVTKAYILDSLNHQYRGKNYKFSDDLLTILESDFKRKARNLDWLFQGKTKISLQPTADDLFMAIQRDQRVTDFIATVIASGYVINPIDFVDGYIVIDKQRLKLKKVSEIIFEKTPPILDRAISERWTKVSIAPVPNKYRPEARLNTSTDLYSVNDLVVNTDEYLISVHPENSVSRRWVSTKMDMNYISSLLNSSAVILSIDINDYITCSEGGVSSCMSMGSSSSRHLGWMMHYRSDFSAITFTHKAGNPFYKTGRSWVFLKLTEDGLPYARPFYKLSRVYGELNDGHVKSVDQYIQTQIKEQLGLGEPKKHTDHKSVSYGQLKSIASPNMQNTNGNFHGTGYFDWPQDSTAYWDRLPLYEYPGEYAVTPFTSENYAKGPLCLFNFPDALDVNGEATNEALFNNNPQHSTSTVFGWNERHKQFVTCSVTGAKILLRDAIELSTGVYLHKEQAIALLSGKTLEPVVVDKVAAKVVKVVEVTDEEILDF